jgi:hypothetical protein
MGIEISIIGLTILLALIQFFPKASSKKWVIFSISITLFVLQIIYAKRSEQSRISDSLSLNALTTNLDMANKKIEALHKIMSLDSLRNKQFENALKEEFKIIRDSLNRPRSISPVYNNYFNNTESAAFDQRTN